MMMMMIIERNTRRQTILLVAAGGHFCLGNASETIQGVTSGNRAPRNPERIA